MLKGTPLNNSSGVVCSEWYTLILTPYLKYKYQENEIISQSGKSNKVHHTQVCQYFTV